MNLRLQAETDLSFTLQDIKRGFGFPVILEDDQSHIIGNDVENPFGCQVGRIHFFIDPDTGLGVEGNFAHVIARMSNLITAGFDVDAGYKGWKVTTVDINGGARSYVARSLNPDHTNGVLKITCGEVTRDNAANEAIVKAIYAGMT